MAEMWDLYDENRKPLNRQHVRGIPLPEGTYHLVADVWTVNTQGKVLITQRHPDKPAGLLWDCSGGSAIAGEDSVSAALRELSEEVGISARSNDLALIQSICYKDRLVDTYIMFQNVELKNLKLQAAEVVDAKFVTYDELVDLWEQGYVVPRDRFGTYHKDIKRYIDEVMKNAGMTTQQEVVEL